MRVLVACEFSGIVREAFAARGHDAWSCDVIPTEIPGQHFQDSVFNHLADEWDLMIAHPPCTHLSASGARWFHKKKTEQAAALEFVQQILNAPIPRIAVENPVGVLSTLIRKPDQIVQPWQSGHSEQKATCFWLKGLPPLIPTEVLARPESGRWSNQTPSGQNKLSPSPDRWKLRSRTYAGVAAAMADQWGS